MSTEKKQLRHRWTSPLTEFFAEIDACGGWPHNGVAVVMRHNDERSCYFVSTPKPNDGWNTTIATADEYYLWKLSPDARKKLTAELRLELNQTLLRFIQQQQGGGKV